MSGECLAPKTGSMAFFDELFLILLSNLSFKDGPDASGMIISTYRRRSLKHLEDPITKTTELLLTRKYNSVLKSLRQINTAAKSMQSYTYTFCMYLIKYNIFLM